MLEDPAGGLVPPAVTLEGETYRETAGSITVPEKLEDAAALMREGLAEIGAETPPELTILCPDDPEITALVNEILVAWNNAFGRYFNMDPLSEDDLASRIAAGSFSAAIACFTPAGNDPVSALTAFSTGNSANVCHFSDTAYDDLLEQARRADGSAKISASCLSAEQYLADKAVFLPVTYSSRVFRQRARRLRFHLPPLRRRRRFHKRPQIAPAAGTPAVGNSRTGFVPAPSRARTRLVPGAGSRRASVFPGREKAWLLFPAAGRKPAGQKPAPNFRCKTQNRGAKRSPSAQKTLEKLSLCSLGFSGVSHASRRFAARRAVKPASSEREGENSRRAQTSPFAQKRLKS